MRPGAPQTSSAGTMVVGSIGAFGLAAAAILVAAVISAWFVQVQVEQSTHQAAATTSPHRPAVETHADETAGPVGASPPTPVPAADVLSQPSTVANESLPELTCDKAALFAWLRAGDGGAFIHPALVLRPSDPSAANSDADVRGADLGVYVNGAAIEAGELLFSVPEVPFALSAAAVAAGLESQPGGGGGGEAADAQASAARNFLRGTEGIQVCESKLTVSLSRSC